MKPISITQVRININTITKELKSISTDTYSWSANSIAVYSVLLQEQTKILVALIARGEHQTPPKHIT